MFDQITPLLPPIPSLSHYNFFLSQVSVLLKYPLGPCSAVGVGVG